MAAMALLLPLILLCSVPWVEMQESMSAFYHTDMRNTFVGMLVAIGVCLYAYKGFTEFENYALTFAGIFLVGVAMLPTSKPEGVVADFTAPTLHNICAIIFFALIVVVCLFARDSGQRNPEDFKQIYRIIAALMFIVLIFGILTLVFTESVKAQFPTAIFWLEFAAIFVFGAYWIAKTVELWNVS